MAEYRIQVREDKDTKDWEKIPYYDVEEQKEGSSTYIIPDGQLQEFADMVFHETYDIVEVRISEIRNYQGFYFKKQG